MEKDILEKYEPTIGLEIHVQLDTKSKMFCRCDNDSENAAPNTNVCPVCMGYGGTLPVMNEQAIRFGARLAAAIGCELNPFQRFDRKNYFYPDLPKGYQISQFFFPMGEHGKIKVDYLASDRKTKKEFQVGITRLHLEEDAGKLTHTGNGSLVDLNRCGTPLAEIVTGPDIHSPEEARAFMQELQRIVRSLGVSKADMEKGHLRVDGNISVRLAGAKELGSKVEIKNLNSFRFLEQALTYEIERQIKMLESGESIVQETRGWDEKSNTTISQRIKEGSVDYRYFPEPDLPPLELTTAWLADGVGEFTKVLPSTVRAKAEEAGLAYDRISEMQDGGALMQIVELVREEKTLDITKLANMATRGRVFEDSAWTKRFFDVAAENNLSATATDKLYDLIAKDQLDPSTMLGEVQGAGTDEMTALVKEMLADNEGEVARYKAGETKLMGFFVGQLMARAQGKADPAVASAMIEKLLTESE